MSKFLLTDKIPDKIIYPLNNDINSKVIYFIGNEISYKIWYIIFKYHFIINIY